MFGLMPVRGTPDRLEALRDFVNTIDREEERDDVATPASLARWLVDRGLLPVAESRLSEADHARAIELREALRRMALANNGEPPSAEATAAVERLAREALLEARFPAGGGWGLEPRAGGMAGSLGRLIAILVEAMADGSWSRLKACSADTCQWLFYDTSKNRSGHWCSMRVCGNRAKARQFRARRRTTAAPR
jgi:predicted RNA-binding Zn ribbon-like protein